MSKSTASSPKGLRGLLQKGALAVLDQGLFAGSNFVINVLLARWLVPDDFGAFSVAYTIFLFAGTIHGGLISEPMLVYGSDRFSTRLKSYIQVLLKGHVAYSALAGILLLAAAPVLLAFGQWELGGALLVLAFAQGVILLQWMARHMCYVRLQPGAAAEGGVVYSILLLGLAALVYKLEWLNGPVALAVMGVASLGAASWIFARLRLFSKVRGVDTSTVQAEAIAVHTNYGKWSATTGVMEWIQSFLPLMILPFFLGLEASGALRALTNFILPLIHIFQVLGVLLIPIFVRARVSGRLKAAVMGTFGGALALGVLFCIALTSGGEWMILTLYDGNYIEYADSLMIVGLVGIAWSLDSVLVALLRSLERPRDVFFGRAAGALTMSSLGVGLVAWLGVPGALWALFAAAMAQFVVIMLILRFQGSQSATGLQSVTALSGDGLPVDPLAIEIEGEVVL